MLFTLFSRRKAPFVGARLIAHLRREDEKIGEGSGRRFPSLYCLMVGCVVLTLLLTGCNDASGGQNSNAAPTNAPSLVPTEDLVTPGVLTVGSYLNYGPQEYLDTATHKATGFDIDLIQAIAQHMGLKVDVIDGSFSLLITHLVNHDFDVVISAVPITVAAQEKVQFIPYFKGGEAMLVEKGNPHRIGNGLDLCGQSVGVRSDTLEQNDLYTLSDSCRKKGKLALNVVARQDNRAVIQLLLARRVVAVYQDAPVADYYIKRYPGRFELEGPINNITFEGIAVRKDDVMFNAVKTAFEAVEKDGTYHALIAKWGLLHGDITIKTK